MKAGDRRQRCEWAGPDPLMIAYHDREWGVPTHDDGVLFELLTLEGAQAGLSWRTVLKKRSQYQDAFDRFDARKIARYSDTDVQRLLSNPGIVRNRLKIASTIGNAKAFLKVQQEFGSFDAYLWGFVDGVTLENRWPALAEIPAKTPLSDTLSRDLKKRRFSFVGSTTCYAFMQAVGMVNDHTLDCFRREEVAGSG